MSNVNIASTLTPSNNQSDKAVSVRQFKVTDIPAAMDKMKWPVAAALMRHWFNGEPWPTPDGAMHKDVKRHEMLPPPQYIEDSIIKMAWAINFEPTKKIVNELRSVWNNPAAQSHISEKIITKYSEKEPGTYPFEFHGSAKEVEAFGYSNNRSVEYGLFEKTDELRASLANFNVRVFPEGILEITETDIKLHVARIGFYIEDSYDFVDSQKTNTSQPLGFWNFDGIANPIYALAHNNNIDSIRSNIVSNLHRPTENTEKTFDELDGSRYFYITNSHFSAYRKKLNKGGDFQVLSDVLYEGVALTTITISIK